ncbi:DUF4192 domain-containing protein [Prescottella subtropica]|uniref:DUF4192 domain-containing protein n=1 Tax=Prescottella subtropica TaxID=2545757 RepID=UPI001386DE6D|nr:DUF4192 domain-containing protein [Prescottella subtropica]
MAVNGHVQENGNDQTRVQISNPGALIAAVPSLLGFVPTESIVCIALDGPKVGLVMRADIAVVTDNPNSAKLLVEQFARSSGFDVFFLIAVSADLTRRQNALRTVSLAFMAAGHIVKDSVHVSEIAAGKRWRNRDGVSGELPDPASTELASVMTATGRQTFGSRDDLAALVAPCGEGLDVGPSPRHYEAVALVKSAREVVDQLGAGQGLTDDDIRMVGRAVTYPPVRDALIALATTDCAQAARDVFAEVARRSRGSARVEALALMGAFAYIGNDGPLAGIAFEAALADQPGHGLSSLLDQARSNSIAPAEVGKLLTLGAREAAVQIGVEPLA